MKNGIHPELHLAHVKCATCGTELTTRWAAGDRTIDTCSQCHPAYTGRAARADRRKPYRAVRTETGSGTSLVEGTMKSVASNGRVI